MSVPTRVIENGQWVTRYVDPFQLLAQDRSKRDSDPDEEPVSPKPPVLGCVTQTLLRSPITRWLYPARVRHKSRNDVLFISENAVQIREALRDYSFAAVATRADFNARIRSAKVFGMPRECTEPNTNAIIKNEDHDQWHSGIDTVKITFQEGDDQDAHRPTSDSETDIETDAMKEEDIDAMVLDDDVQRIQHNNDKSLEIYRHLPPQLLVMVLENDTMVFLYAISGPATIPRLVVSQKLLASSRTHLEQLGEHLAVDPRSRACAVAAVENWVYLYVLKSRRRLRDELRLDEQLQPIEGERAFKVDGSIHKMEFLHTTETSDECVILLLVVVKHGKSKLMWFVWDTRTDLRMATIEPASHPLPSADSVPLLLVPLLSCTAVMLVSQTQTSIYKNFLAGSLEPSNSSRYLQHDSEEPACSKGAPLWVQWARPMRSGTGEIGDDNIYLCREDGVVRYIDFKAGQEMAINAAGKLNRNVNTSFAVIDLGPKADDMLVIGGDSSDGGVWISPPREATDMLSTKFDWTPQLYNVMMSPDHGRLESASPDRAWDTTKGRDHCRLFAAVGKGKFGAVVELKPCISTMPEMESIELGSSITIDSLKIHAFEQDTGDILIYISQSTRTLLLVQRLLHNPELVDEKKGLDLDSRTLAIYSKSNGSTVQVTEKGIFGISAAGDLWTEFVDNSGMTIVTANCNVFEKYLIVCIATQETNRSMIRIGTVDEALPRFSDPFCVDAIPSCIVSYTTTERVLTFVATTNGHIDVYSTQLRSLTVSEQPLAGFQFDKRAFEICESMAICGNTQVSGEYFLTCGLRNGKIYVLRFKLHPEPHLELREQIAVGHTAVHVESDWQNPMRVLVHCHEQCYSLSYPGDCLSLKAVLRPIFGTVAGLTHCETSDVLTMTPVNRAGIDRESTNLVLFMTRDMLHLTRMHDSEMEAVQRRWQLGGSPAAMMFSEQIDKLVVLSVETAVLRYPTYSGPRANPGRRGLRPMVTFLDLKTSQQPPHPEVRNGQEDDTLEDGAVEPQQALSSIAGEKHIGMCEWFPTVGGKRYHLMIFNTLVKSIKKLPSGRLLIYAVLLHGRTLPELSLKKTIVTSSPVYTVSPIPNEPAIMYACGNDLVALWLDLSQGYDNMGFRFSPAITTTLRSPVRHMTFNPAASIVYATTASESLQVYSYSPERLQHRYGDTVARNGLSHLHLEGSDIDLAADMAGNLVGLWLPPSQPAVNCFHTLFEAYLPQATTRLLKSSQPSWMKDILIPFKGIFLEKDLHDAGDPMSSIEDDTCSLETQDRRPHAIICCSTDGTIHQLQLLSVKAFLLLKFIQNMCERHETIKPFVLSGNASFKHHLEPRMDNPRFMHVNGDILHRLLERGSSGLLAEMLDANTPKHDSEDRFVDFNDPADRYARFEVLAAEVLGSDSLQNVTREELLQEICRWIGYVLRSAL